jgi:hypothetical protein
MPSKSVKKYLNTYAEAGTQSIQTLGRCYDYVCVIPICNEAEDCLSSIFGDITSNDILLIVVVNSPIAASASWQSKNNIFIKQLKCKSNSICQLSSDCDLLKFDGFNDVILVDKNCEGQQLNPDYGVGLARKIGCDMALWFYTKGWIKYPWVFSTDADVILPADYFIFVSPKQGKYSAIALDFKHISDDTELTRYQYYYDFKIRYYHAGISYAGSAYDYIPLGSCLIVDFKCYAQVRGFPKKNAGEDFYLLNKLAKIKPVNFDQHNPVMQIRSRFSDRVPFGTGPALNKIKKLHSIDEYHYYHPQCFIQLRNWMVYLNSLWYDGALHIEAPQSNELLALFDFFKCQNVFTKSSKQISSEKRWQDFVHQWFDSFKTLKAVHFFDKKHPDLNYLQLLNTQSFAKVANLTLENLTKYDEI